MRHTIKDLGLNLPEARTGRTWLLLPKEYRSTRLSQEYPLPVDIKELALLAAIPPAYGGRDCGSLYLRRAQREYSARLRAKTGAHISIERAEHEATQVKKRLDETLAGLAAEAEQAVNQVKAEAKKAVASLDVLFELGRQGLEGQMKAHLAGEEWQDEKISAAAFRDCFRMVSGAVKGLGLPSGEREKAKDVVFGEIAKSLNATRSALSSELTAEEEESPN